MKVSIKTINKKDILESKSQFLIFLGLSVIEIILWQIANVHIRLI